MSNEDNINAQKALIAQLEAEQRDKANAQLYLTAHREDEYYVAHPLFDRTYKWSGNKLVRMNDDEGVNGLRQALRAGWDATWGKAFTKKFWKGQGLGQGIAVKDPWGKMTTNLPISVRLEVEQEEELERIHREIAPYADEFMHGMISGSTQVHVFRVDNLITGKPKYPTYAIPYKDKFGATQIAIGKKDAHAALYAFQEAQKQGRVAAVLTNFNEKAFGYDMKLFMFSPYL